jgi:hypothetical protein
MWDKFKILEYSIPDQYNNGFFIDYRNNYIINFTKNYQIKLPFKIYKNTYSNFELILDNNILSLNLYINANKPNSIKYNRKLANILIKSHNHFKIDNNEKNKIIEFLDLDDIIINNKKSIKNNIINLNNKYINLKRYDYIPNNYIISPIFYFVYGNISNFNISKSMKICIIDKNLCLSNKILSINASNYKNITKYNISKSKFIYIDSQFFFSKKYLNFYKNNNKEGYINAKKTIFNGNILKKIYNIELFNNIVFIIKNYDINKLYKHPVLFSSNHIILESNLFSLEVNRQITKKLIKINNSISIDNNIYVNNYINKLCSTYNHAKKFKLRIDFNNLLVDYYITQKLSNDKCPILKEYFNYKSWFSLNCGHKFIAQNDTIKYISKRACCPYCTNQITKINFNINRYNILCKLGVSLENCIVIYKNNNKFITFLRNNLFECIQINYNFTFSFSYDYKYFLILNDINHIEFSNSIIFNVIDLNRCKFIFWECY